MVEGLEDVAFISTHLGLADQLAQFRGLGCHFVVAGGKKNLSRLVAISQELDIPHFVIFDADANQEKKEAGKDHEKDNRCLMRLCGVKTPEPFPKDIFWGLGTAVWPENIQDCVQKDFGADDWNAASKAAKNAHGLQERVRPKNQMLIGYTLEQLHKLGKRSAVLVKLCGNILSHAEKAQLGRATPIQE